MAHWPTYLNTSLYTVEAWPCLSCASPQPGIRVLSCNTVHPKHWGSKKPKVGPLYILKGPLRILGALGKARVDGRRVGRYSGTVEFQKLRIDDVRPSSQPVVGKRAVFHMSLGFCGLGLHVCPKAA